MTIVTRKQLGRPLTWDELDGNFSQVDSLVAQAGEAVSTAQGAVTTSANNAAQAAQSATDAAASAQNAGSAVSRSLRAPQGETLNELPAASLRQNKVQTFNATGQPALSDITGFVQLDNTGKIPAAQLPSTIVTSVNGKQGAAVIGFSDLQLAQNNFIGRKTTGTGGAEQLTAGVMRHLLRDTSANSINTLLSFLLNFQVFNDASGNGCIKFPPVKGAKNGFMVAYGVNSGDKTILFPEPFNKCYGVYGTMQQTITAYVESFNAANVKPYGFDAHPRFINSSNQTGTPTESYFWFAIGEL